MFQRYTSTTYPPTANATLAAAAPSTLSLNIEGSADWSLGIVNTGANPVTAVTVKLIPKAAVPTVFYSDTVAAARVLAALVAGGTAVIDSTNTPSAYESLEVVLTSTLGTTITITNSVICG